MSQRPKTREQLRLELIAWQQRLQAQRLVSQQVRSEIGRMQSSQDVEALVRVIYEGLRTLEVPFADSITTWRLAMSAVSREECVSEESRTFLERVHRGEASPLLANFLRLAGFKSNHHRSAA